MSREIDDQVEVHTLSQAPVPGGRLVFSELHFFGLPPVPELRKMLDNPPEGTNEESYGVLLPEDPAAGLALASAIVGYYKERSGSATS